MICNLLDWLNEYSDAVTAAATLALVIVTSVYARLTWSMATTMKLQQQESRETTRTMQEQLAATLKIAGIMRQQHLAALELHLSQLNLAEIQAMESAAAARARVAAAREGPPQRKMDADARATESAHSRIVAMREAAEATIKAIRGSEGK